MNKYVDFAIQAQPIYPGAIEGSVYIHRIWTNGERDLFTWMYRHCDGSIRMKSESKDADTFVKRVSSAALSMTDSSLEQFCDKIADLLKNGATTDVSEKREFQPIFTDEEHRILLAAMAREQQVCKKADEEYGDERLSEIVDSIFKKIHALQHKE